MTELADAVGALADRIAALERPLLLALDVDGTLAPIVDEPNAAAVPVEVVRTLERLSKMEGILIALVTGRDAAQLERMVRLPLAWRVTEHGRVRRAPGAEPTPPLLDPDAQPRLARFAAWAHAQAHGARIEEKPASVVVHVRSLAAQDPAASAELLARAAERATAEGLFVREGRAVVEAEVEPGDKGRALREIARRAGVLSVVYAGDDRTDEPAILAASERGIGIFVRSAERPDPPLGTRAVIDGPSAMAALLRRLEERLG